VHAKVGEIDISSAPRPFSQKSGQQKFDTFHLTTPICYQDR